MFRLGFNGTCCSSNKTDANSSDSSKEKQGEQQLLAHSEKDQKESEEEQKKWNSAQILTMPWPMKYRLPQLSTDIGWRSWGVKKSQRQGDICEALPKYIALLAVNFLTLKRATTMAYFHHVSCFGTFMIQTGGSKRKWYWWWNPSGRKKTNPIRVLVLRMVFSIPLQPSWASKATQNSGPNTMRNDIKLLNKPPEKCFQQTTVILFHKQINELTWSDKLTWKWVGIHL